MPSHRPENVLAILDALASLYPDAGCELVHASAFELLISTILSAQCTDAQVNAVTPELFRRWPDARALAASDPSEVEQVIHSTGFFRSKARSIRGAAASLLERHAGIVPREMDALVALPGVARKTANVVLGTAFGIAEGVVVDTHVFRVTRRWGWHQESSPEKVERILMDLVPRDAWNAFGHRGVLFGRYRCPARRPPCETCPMRSWCPVGQGRADP
ncbi:MAG: endonuclease III [Deltaproteobacteria bacterium]|nr:endonuclease III [Deltaproteobacteria bacterium]